MTIELKIAAENQDLKAVAKGALTQIQAKQYNQAMRAQGIEIFRYLGIAFKKKEVAVVTSKN